MFLARILRRAAVVCLSLGASLTTVLVSHAAAGVTEAAPPPPVGLTARSVDRTAIGRDELTRGHHGSEPIALHASDRSPAILAYAPPRSASAPLTVVYLHGVHGRAAKGCPWIRSGASDVGWLVCPEGVVHEEGNVASWGGDVPAQAAVVADAVRAAERAGASSEPGVAVGFSQGSYVALDLVKTHLGRFRGLVLMAAPDAHPSAAKLRAAGVTRIALAAGSLDREAYAALVSDVERLSAEGADARFFDLGAVGHTYAAENTDALREAIVWAAGRS